ncbi:MAG: biopolymer transporter ExbD [Candidatus Hydrogenedentes bacterium]|nr:biopolymer transporter ExbD [Candidatus Hydrogenedentota bacterium]
MHFKRQHKRRIVASLDMTPLIDVVLLLLFFFMLSSTFVAQTSVPIRIPEAEGTPELETKDAMLVLQSGEGGPDNEGIIQVSGGAHAEPLEVGDWAALTEALSAIGETTPDAFLMIYADERVTSGRMVKVLGIANSVGIEHFSVAAQTPDDG